MSEPKIKTKPEDRIPIIQKLSWGSGGILDQFMSMGIATLGLLIFNIGLGVNAFWITLGMSIPRFFDAVIDPFIGNITDNARTRWGRRRPFIFIGAFLCAISFAAVWMPPTSLIGKDLTLNFGKGFIFHLNLPVWLGGAINWHLGGPLHVPHLFLFFTIMSMFYYFAYAVFIIPQNAMGIELSTDYHERTRLQSWKLFLGCLGGIALGYMYLLAQNPIFCGKTVPGGLKPEVIGIRPVAMIAAVIVLFSGLMSAIFCKGRVDLNVQQEKINVWKAMKMTLTNWPFLILTGVIFNLLIGLFIVGPFSNYINIYYICAGDKVKAAGLGATLNLIYQVLSIAIIPVATWISTLWGKRTTMIVAQISVMIGSASSIFMFTPAHPYWQFLPPLAMCPGLTCIWILGSSMLAEICDLDELKTGLRQEGMFGAVFALVFKAGIAAVTALSGLMLVLSGLKDGADVQPVRTLTILRWEFALVPVGFLIISTFLTWLFPITEKSAREVRAQLEARKQAAVTEAVEAAQ